MSDSKKYLSAYLPLGYEACLKSGAPLLGKDRKPTRFKLKRVEVAAVPHITYAEDDVLVGTFILLNGYSNADLHLFEKPKNANKPDIWTSLENPNVVLRPVYRENGSEIQWF